MRRNCTDSRTGKLHMRVIHSVTWQAQFSNPFNRTWILINNLLCVRACPYIGYVYGYVHRVLCTHIDGGWENFRRRDDALVQPPVQHHPPIPPPPLFRASPVSWNSGVRNEHNENPEIYMKRQNFWAPHHNAGNSPVRMRIRWNRNVISILSGLYELGCDKYVPSPLGIVTPILSCPISDRCI